MTCVSRVTLGQFNWRDYIPVKSSGLINSILCMVSVEAFLIKYLMPRYNAESLSNE